MPKKKPQDEIGKLNPYEIFSKYFTGELFEEFNESSNIYINNSVKDRAKTRNFYSQYRRKFSVDTNEIKVFLGLILFMSLNKHGNYQGK